MFIEVNRLQIIKPGIIIVKKTELFGIIIIDTVCIIFDI